MTVHQLERWSAAYSYLISHRVADSGGTRIGSLVGAQVKLLGALVVAGVLARACLPPSPAAARDALPAVAVAGPAAAAAGCGDFLGRMHKTPAHVIYAGCRAFPERQGKPLVATYRVGGRFAAAAAASLIRSVGLMRLKRSCCQWDAPTAQFRDARGREYSITMASEETTIAARSAWPRIGTFEITVELLTDDI